MLRPTLNTFALWGAQLAQGALQGHLDKAETALGPLRTGEPGVRIHDIEALKPLLVSGGCIGSIAASVLGEAARPVRAILFNKTPKANWALGWHQDRTICVKEKREAPGFGPWTVKVGLIHVEPPFEVLAGMVTLRAHLDDVAESNAPLLIAPGSHLLGRLTVREIEEAVGRCGTQVCLAQAGDVWLYSTPILHASEAASAPTRRRVLQVDYAVGELPHGLQWLGV